MTEILENQPAWSAYYRQHWLAALQKTGTIDWKVYRHPRNNAAPGIPGVDLRKTRLMLVTSTGAYLKAEQEPFDAPNLLGDYTLRVFPASTPLAALAYAHDHYDRTMIERDPQVAIPLRHLDAMVAAGEIGALAPSVASFMGYQPDSARVVDELVPQIVELAKSESVQAALLAPV